MTQNLRDASGPSVIRKGLSGCKEAILTTGLMAWWIQIKAVKNDLRLLQSTVSKIITAYIQQSWLETDLRYCHLAVDNYISGSAISVYKKMYEWVILVTKYYNLQDKAVETFSLKTEGAIKNIAHN